MPGPAQPTTEDLFQRAADLPASERDSFLDRCCADDPERRRKIEKLLYHYQAANDEAFLGEVWATEIRPGTTFGSYRLERVLGEGGMGLVFLAEQDKPRRPVALKVLPPDRTTASMLKRFEVESELHGRLRHPGIAQIFEAGTASITFGGAERRLPYMAMEYVRGEPLLEYAETRGLGTRERIELVARICDAVHHAHLQGVIHRDLKPANLLVDADGWPKILDFGIARAVDSNVTQAERTGAGQLLGTVAYMSPEHVGGNSQEIDVRSDVYALGVVLFQLVSGALPLPLENLSLAAAARTITEEEPRRLGSLRPDLRGDLSLIAARALGKTKARRYQSAAALADDLRRYLDGRPIAARGDSVMYVLRKQARRYRWAVATAGAVLAGVVVFGVYALRQASVMSRLATREAEAKATAEARLTESLIERGRLLARSGNILAAEDILWPEHLADPGSDHVYWALWELYSRLPCRRTLVAHDDEIQHALLMDNGARLVTGSIDGTVRLWHAADMSPLAKLEIGAPVRDVALSPDEQFAAVAGPDGEIQIWDLATQTRRARVPVGAPSTAGVCYTPDGHGLVVVNSDGEMWAVDAAGGDGARRLVEGLGHLVTVRVSPDGAHVLACTLSGEVFIFKDPFDAPVATSAAIVNSPEGSVALLFTPDGAGFYTAGADRGVRRWDFEGNCIDPSPSKCGFVTGCGAVRGLALIDGGRTLIATGWWATEFWDLESRRLLHSYAAQAHVNAMAVTPDEETLILATGSHLQVWDLRPRGVQRLPERWAATFARDQLLLADAHGGVATRERETGDAPLAVVGEVGTVGATRARFMTSNAEATLLAVVLRDGTLSVRDRATWEEHLRLPDRSPWTVPSVAFHPDGRTIASVAADSSIDIHDAVTGARLHTLPAATQDRLGVCFSPDGATLAAVVRYEGIELWSLAPAPRVTRRIDYTYTPWTVKFSPDGRHVLAGTWGKDVCMWDQDTGELRLRLVGHNATVWSIDIHPHNDRLIASASADGTVRLWDLDAGRHLATIDAFGDDEARFVQFSPDGTRLVVVARRGQVGVWDLATHARHIDGNRDYQRARHADVTERRGEFRPPSELYR